MNNLLIELQGVTKKYGDRSILNNIDLQLCKGEICVIMGPSGSGKSTLLNICSFIERMDNGRYLWQGKDISSMNQNNKRMIRKNKMGIIFQDFNLFEELTVFENLNIYLQYTSQLSEMSRKNLISKECERFKLTDILLTKVKYLSGGERQRVSILRSMMNNIEVLFADEPTANVDEENRAGVLEAFVSLKEKGIAVIIVTHDVIYKSIADRVYVMKSGILKEEKISSF